MQVAAARWGKAGLCQCCRAGRAGGAVGQVWKHRPGPSIMDVHAPASCMRARACAKTLGCVSSFHHDAPVREQRKLVSHLLCFRATRSFN
jgi:hypothetical protein